MSSESEFWAVELTKGKPECTWPNETRSIDDEADEAATYILEVERACLGVSAKQSDLNVVSVHTFVNDGESTAVTPIARLKVGGKEQCRIGLQFNSQVTFKLSSGNGPVHLMGLKETFYDDEDDLEDSDSEEEGEEAHLPAIPAFAPKKRPAAAAAAPPAKKQQRGVSVPQDDDSMDDSDEEDSDDEMNLMAANPKLAKLAGRLPAGDEDDSEEDDDDDDDFDDDDDEDDDEDDSEDDSEEDEAPQLVPAKGKGKPQQQQQQKGKGPQQQQKGGKPGQQQQKQQGKPQQTPQKGKDSSPANFEAIAKKVTSSPNLPKKQDKFINLLKNNYKITDQKMINELWARVQKDRK